MFLVNYKGTWYRSEDGFDGNTNRVIQFFDMVVEVTGTEYNVVKNRWTGETGTTGMSDLLKVKFWTEGKNFEQLPYFITYPDTRGPLSLAYDENNNLVTVSTIDNWDPRN